MMKGAALGAGALFGGMGVNPMMAGAIAKEAGRSSKPLKAAFLQRRATGDLVRPGQTGGGILGQTVQRRSDLV